MADLRAAAAGWTLGAVTDLVGLALAAGLFWAAWVSRGEGERRAAGRLAVAGLAALALFIGGGRLPPPGGAWVSAFLLLATLLGAALFLLPFRGRLPEGHGTPRPGVDERDIMFSRALLIPGTERYEAYYRSRPEFREPDDAFRREPGLLAPGSVQFHLQGFAAADAAFWTIEKLRPFVEGEPEPTGAEEERSALGGGAVGAAPAQPAEPEAMSRFLKAWALKMGAHSAGVTEVRDYHLYSYVGRGPDRGKPVELDHPYAVALTVEMDKEMVDRAPRAPTLMESAYQYLRCGVMAVQMADLIRRLGYRARAHVDGNYRVICPLVARDAGLGELGRMGLLMTPRLGPRVRIAVVTTDMPLLTDQPVPAPSVLDFCLHCVKCAEACPSRALPFGEPRPDENGVRRWKIDAEACFTLWMRQGTDCARCMAVCPYSHPDNGLHALVRWGVRRNALFRRAAIRMDDWVYGRRPPPKPLPDWMEISGDGERRRT